MLGYAAAEVIDKMTPADIFDPQELIARAKALSHELGTLIAPGFDALVFQSCPREFAPMLAEQRPLFRQTERQAGDDNVGPYEQQGSGPL